MDESVTQKRKRGPNFRADERQLLHELIDKHKDILESKRNNFDIIQGKRHAWQDICNEFNSHVPYGLFRNVETLKYAYENDKRKVRLRMAESLRTAHDDPDPIVFRCLDAPEVRKFEPHSEDDDNDDDDVLVVVKSQIEEDETCNFTQNALSNDKSDTLTNSEKLVKLKVELLEQQLRAAKAEAEMKHKIYQLKIRNLELDIRLKEQQLK